MDGLYSRTTIYSESQAKEIGATLVINDALRMCCGQRSCDCYKPTSNSNPRGEEMSSFIINPEKAPTPYGLVDNAIDGDDILPIPMMFDNEATAAMKLALRGKSEEDFPPRPDGEDSQGNRLQPAADQGKMICEQCNGVVRLPNAEYTKYVRDCPPCDGTGFHQRSGTTTEPQLVGNINISDEDDILPMPKMIF